MSRILLGFFLIYLCVVAPLHAATARSRVQFVAVESTGTVHWPAGRAIISFPYNEKNRPTGLVVFEGQRMEEHELAPVVGGTIIVQPEDGQPEVLRDIWEFKLVELGLVDLTGQGNDDIYFVSMEGDGPEYWHFNLFNPRKAALVTVTYSFAGKDQALNRSTSENYEKGEFKKERVFLEDITRTGGYPIPDIDKWLKK